MSWLRFKRTLRITRYAADVKRDVGEEIDFYLEMRTRELIAEGVEPEEAAQRARLAFGDREEIERRCRRLSSDVRRRRRLGETLASVLGDVRHGLRDLAGRPGLTAVVLLTWALCIGANAVIFTLVDDILLRPLPYPTSERLVTIYGSLPDAGTPRVSSTLGDHEAIREQITALESVALYNKVSAGVGEAGEVRNVFCMHVTPSFFDVLGVTPSLGAGFGDTEREVVISHNLWQGQFGGSAGVIGRQMSIEKEPYTIVGVMPPGFLFADWEAHLWFPVRAPAGATLEELNRDGGYEMVGRLKEQGSVVELRVQLEALYSELLEAAPPKQRQRAAKGGFRMEAHGLLEHQVREIRPWLLLVWGGVAFVLLIGWVNIASLLLMRNSSRLGELAMRSALGAARSRLVRQLGTESLVLAIAGAVVGLLAGAWCLGLLSSFEEYEIPRVADVKLDVTVIALTLGLTVAVGLLAGMVPALVMRLGSLHQIVGTGAARAAGAPSFLRLRAVLVAAQVAVAFVLLVGAALMITSLGRILAVDPGFDTEDVLAAATVVPWSSYGTPEVRHQAIDQILERMRGVPGVRDAAVADSLPFSGVTSQSLLASESGSIEGGGLAAPFATVVSPSYFATLGIPILEGRAFDERDSGRYEPVMIVDELVARRHWPDESAVGKRVRIESRSGASEPLYTVVGVAGRIVQNDLTDPEPNGAFYLPHRDTGLTFMRLALRTEVPPRSVVPLIRDRLLALDPELRFFWVQTMQEAVDERLILRRLPMFLLAGFAAVALLLSALGVYGVLAQTVLLRSPEIGVRLALGGTPRAVGVLLLRGALWPLVGGLLAGAVAALLLTGLLTGLLYEVQPNSPEVFLAVASTLVAATLLACVLPLRRALRVDPVTTLR